MSNEQLDSTRRDDVAWCFEAVHGVSRTFSLTISELEEPMARDICVGYLLCRVADTIEDSGRIPAAEQAALLRRYERVLDPEDPTTVDSFERTVAEWVPADPSADWRVVANAGRVVSAFETVEPHARRSIRPPVRELVEGMAMFVDRYAEPGGLRIQTLDELEEYCWYAAGTVGELVTGLVSKGDDPETVRRRHEHGRAFALLLQLVNVAKDVADDYEEENNVYLPHTFLDEAGLEPADVADESNASAVAGVVERVVDHAAGYLDGAQRWLETMPRTRGNTLAAWAVPYLLAVGTLRELRARPEEVVERGDVKVSREEVHALLSRFGEGDEPSVAELRDVMQQRPLDQA
ncbi:phytoene/squalene synthase family protein [Halospeciosus flavus]|uniref:Phytoene/squalene synthase family protein n=1 Tax=Halospeciosus flavus TaxID=3032283 RepID=A0ABD5Z0E8_9EURY|nr:phytoene/squalene synthase family protein [Halospeciosus flavus]